MILGGQSHRISKGLLSLHAQSIQALTVVQSSGNRPRLGSVAALAFGPAWLVRSANTDTAIKVSAVLAVLSGVLILFAFTKFRKRALWFLLGTPVIVFWFFVLFLIAWASAHNIKACP
jgi:hypothetical protein